jgi:hypothetical protein
MGFSIISSPADRPACSAVCRLAEELRFLEGHHQVHGEAAAFLHPVRKQDATLAQVSMPKPNLDQKDWSEENRVVAAAAAGPEGPGPDS